MYLVVPQIELSQIANIFVKEKKKRKVMLEIVCAFILVF